MSINRVLGTDSYAKERLRLSEIDVVDRCWKIVAIALALNEASKHGAFPSISMMI